MKGRIAAGLAGLAVATLALAGTTATASGTSANWTQWGFNAQHTGYNPLETALTRANVGHLVRAFSTRLPGQSGDPIVAGGVVYLAGGSGNVDAINSTSGALKWTLYPNGPCNEGTDVSDPAFAANHIWVGLDDPGVAELSTSGASISCIEEYDLFVAPPSAGNGMVYAGADDGALVAINATTAGVRWLVTLGSGAGLASPTLSADGTALYIGAYDGYVYKVNAATGAVIWSHYIDTCGQSTVAASGSMLYVSGCAVYGLSAATGAVIWTGSGLNSPSAPAVAGGLVFAAGQYSGVAAFNATNGKMIWDKLGSQGELPVTPTVANGVVYVDDHPLNHIVMLNSSTGAQLGSLSLSASSDAVFEGAVIPVDGRVYVCTMNLSNYVFSLNAYMLRS